MQSLPDDCLYLVAHHLDVPGAMRIARCSRDLYSMLRLAVFRMDAKSYNSRATRWALEHGRMDIFRQFLDTPDLDVDRVRSGEYSLILYAIECNSQEALDLLLARGADPNLATRQYQSLLSPCTPLSLTLQMNRTDMLASLARTGYQVNYVEAYDPYFRKGSSCFKIRGITGLDSVSRVHSLFLAQTAAMAKFLLSQGVDPTTRHTTLQTTNNHQPMTPYSDHLLSHIDDRYLNCFGVSPVQWLVQHSPGTAAPIIKVLLEGGVPVDSLARDISRTNDHTALDLAVRNLDSESIRVLLEHDANLVPFGGQNVLPGLFGHRVWERICRVGTITSATYPRPLEYEKRLTKIKSPAQCLWVARSDFYSKVGPFLKEHMNQVERRITECLRLLVAQTDRHIAFRTLKRRSGLPKAVHAFFFDEFLQSPETASLLRDGCASNWTRARGLHGRTPLYWLTSRTYPFAGLIRTCESVRKPELLRYLLCTGADPTEVDRKDGLTPLHWALFWLDAEAVQTLAQGGANIDPGGRCWELLSFLRSYRPGLDVDAFSREAQDIFLKDASETVKERVQDASWASNRGIFPAKLDSFPHYSGFGYALQMPLWLGIKTTDAWSEGPVHPAIAHPEQFDMHLQLTIRMHAMKNAIHSLRSVRD